MYRSNFMISGGEFFPPLSPYPVDAIPVDEHGKHCIQNKSDVIYPAYKKGPARSFNKFNNLSGKALAAHASQWQRTICYTSIRDCLLFELCACHRTGMNPNHGNSPRRQLAPQPIGEMLDSSFCARIDG